MLERIIELYQVWQHYSNPEKQYQILGINLVDEKPIDYLYSYQVGRDEQTYNPIGVYLNIEQELQIYSAICDGVGQLFKVLEMIKEPLIVYEALYGKGDIWARSPDKFLGKVYYEDKWLNRFERIK